MGLPAIGARGLPGKRFESYRDGIKVITFTRSPRLWGPDQGSIKVADAVSDSHAVTLLTLTFSLFSFLLRNA